MRLFKTWRMRFDDYTTKEYGQTQGKNLFT